jgi:hypothetical protein
MKPEGKADACCGSDAPGEKAYNLAIAANFNEWVGECSSFYHRSQMILK